MQNKSIIENQIDIPFNFLVGEDGQTYEGRGWVHESGFSNITTRNCSITIGVMGDFTHHPPSKKLLEETKSLISESIRRQRLLADYRIYGVRNRTVSERDGKALFETISNWMKWDSVIDVV